MLSMRRAMLVWLAAAPFVSGCLPGDTRPTPGSVFITAEPSPEVLSGFVTADGWQISFDKLLMGLGDARLVDVTPGSCNSAAYEGGRYTRFFDFTVPGPQKVEQVFALGTCSLHINLWTAGSTTLRGLGVTEGDVALMRESDLLGDPCGLADFSDAGYVFVTSVYARGQASRGASTMRFEWAFPRWFRLFDCPASGSYDAGIASQFTLNGGDALRPSIVVHGEELFRPNGDEASAPRFDAIAAADANGDHLVTLEELFAVPASDPPDNLFPPRCPTATPTMADILETKLVPSMIRINGSNPCSNDDMLE